MELHIKYPFLDIVLSWFYALHCSKFRPVQTLTLQSSYDLRLVAKDLEQATRIGLQGKTRHRVVTLLDEPRC